MYKRIPIDAFKHLQMNAGIICDSFDVGTGTIGNIIGATNGGVQITATPNYEDMSDNMDNCPKNTMELKRIKDWDCKASGTFVTTTASAMKSLIGCASIDGNHITLKDKLSVSDFLTLWFVGDYGDAGFLAVKLSNALNTKGLDFKTEDSNKGQLSFEYQGHYSLDDSTKAPLDIYIKDKVTLYPVTYSLTGVTASIKPIEIASGADLVAKFTANSSYELPTTITVKVGSSTKAEGTDYTWDEETGILYIFSTATTGNVEIIVTGTTQQ